MNIVFMGNPSFAVPTLQLLSERKFDILMVVTNSSKPFGRGQRQKPTDVSVAARKLKLNVFETDDLTSIKTLRCLTDLNADVFVVVAYRILPKSILEIPKYGAINLHGSLLPHYRGAAPIQWALINGDKKTGLSTFLIQPKVDHGDILLQKELPIKEEDNYGSLWEKMSRIGAELMIETVAGFENIIPVPQNVDKATSAPKITKELTIIDWKKTAEEIHNLVRGLSPIPGARTNLQGKKLKIFRSNVVGIEPGDAGIVHSIKKDHFNVQTGAGLLKVYELQVEGKKRLPTSEFLKGFQLKIGTRLGQ